jgi:hypothetical protein
MFDWHSGHDLPKVMPPAVMMSTPMLATTGIRTAWFAGSCLEQFGHVKVSTADV